MTPEISLRPWKRIDAKPLVHIANNKNIWNNLRDSLPHPYTMQDAEQWIMHCGVQKPVINFAILYNAVVAGSIGCVPKNDVYYKSMEIGYFIGEDFWKLGIATQAVRILIDYIMQHFDIVRLYAEVFSKNKASMKVLYNNGFYLESIRRKSVVKNKVLMDDYVWVKLLKE